MCITKRLVDMMQSTHLIGRSIERIKAVTDKHTLSQRGKKMILSSLDDIIQTISLLKQEAEAAAREQFDEERARFKQECSVLRAQCRKEINKRLDVQSDNDDLFNDNRRLRIQLSRTEVQLRVQEEDLEIERQIKEREDDPLPSNQQELDNEAVFPSDLEDMAAQLSTGASVIVPDSDDESEVSKTWEYNN